MNTPNLNEPSDQHAEREAYRGYLIAVGAVSDDGENWRPVIEVQRDGLPVELDAPASAQPYWATRAEALRAGVEQARYLVDRRDGLLDRRNPARPPVR